MRNTKGRTGLLGSIRVVMLGLAGCAPLEIDATPALMEPAEEFALREAFIHDLPVGKDNASVVKECLVSGDSLYVLFTSGLSWNWEFLRLDLREGSLVLSENRSLEFAEETLITLMGSAPPTIAYGRPDHPVRRQEGLHYLSLPVHESQMVSRVTSENPFLGIALWCPTVGHLGYYKVEIARLEGSSVKTLAKSPEGYRDLAGLEVVCDRDQVWGLLNTGTGLCLLEYSPEGGAKESVVMAHKGRAYNPRILAYDGKPLIGWTTSASGYPPYTDLFIRYQDSVNVFHFGRNSGPFDWVRRGDQVLAVVDHSWEDPKNTISVLSGSPRRGWRRTQIDTNRRNLMKVLSLKGRLYVFWQFDHRVVVDELVAR